MIWWSWTSLSNWISRPLDCIGLILVGYICKFSQSLTLLQQTVDIFCLPSWKVSVMKLGLASCCGQLACSPKIGRHGTSSYDILVQERSCPRLWVHGLTPHTSSGTGFTIRCLTKCITTTFHHLPGINIQKWTVPPYPPDVRARTTMPLHYAPHRTLSFFQQQ